MQIYLPPDSRPLAAPAAPATAAPAATTAVDKTAVAAPVVAAAELGGSVKAEPGAGRIMRSRVEAKYWSRRV